MRAFVFWFALIGLMIVPNATHAQTDPPLTRSYPPRDIAFTQQHVEGELLAHPTTLQFGPDDRLYVGQQNGLLWAYTLARDSQTKQYTISATEIIAGVKTIPNHNDDGTLAPGIMDRQITGLLVTGTAEHPILYVTSSDARRGLADDLNLDTNSGIISRLTRTSPGLWEKVDLVRGLPRSEEYHSVNGMVLDEATNILYVAIGSNTNKGAPSNDLSYTPDYALSAAILSVDLNVIDALPVQTDSMGQKYHYDLPTLDDPTRGEPGQPDPGDPFGGNDGLNQAMIVEGGPVQVYSSGYRNPYDLVLTETTNPRRMYTFDNGPNQAWGSVVDGDGTPNCTNMPPPVDDFFPSEPDNLHLVTEGFYAGHPNATRGNPAGAGLYYMTDITPPPDAVYEFTKKWTPVPFAMADPRQCNYLPAVDRDGDGKLDDGALATLPFSTNGLVEYTGSNFGNAMKGNLLATSYDDKVHRFVLNAEGDQVTLQEPLFTGFSYQPLDVTAQGDLDIFPGTVWLVTYFSERLTVFEPVDFAECLGTDDPLLDEDLDGFTNADEIDNGTNPCSGHSHLASFDGSLALDLNSY